MSDLGIGALKPGMGSSAPPSSMPPQPGQAPPGGAPQPEGAGGLPQGITPAMVAALRTAVEALREIPNMTDQDIVDLLMQAISAKGLDIASEDIEQMVAAVPPKEGQQGVPPGAPPGAPPPGMPPQGMPPQGAPPIGGAPPIM